MIADSFAFEVSNKLNFKSNVVSCVYNYMQRYTPQWTMILAIQHNTTVGGLYHTFGICKKSTVNGFQKVRDVVPCAAKSLHEAVVIVRDVK